MELEDLPRFTKKLRPGEEIAVEMTGDTRFFHEAVAPHVARVVTVDPDQFKVISQSVKKTDRRNDRGGTPGDRGANSRPESEHRPIWKRRSKIAARS